MVGIATAMVATAVVGGYVANKSSKRQAKSVDNAAAMEYELGVEQLALSKEELAYNKIRGDRLDAIQQQVSAAQIGSMNRQLELAEEYATYNRETFRPLEKSMVAEAASWDSPERQEAEAAKASATFKGALQTQKQATARDMARMGVNPASGRASDINAKQEVSAALGVAGMENTARDNTKAMAWAKKMDASSLGRNLPSAQATAAQTGVNAGSAAVAAGATANQSYQNGLSAPISLMNGASSSFSNAARTRLGIMDASNAAWGQTMQGVGSAAGMAMRYGGGFGGGGSAAGGGVYSGSMGMGGWGDSVGDYGE